MATAALPHPLASSIGRHFQCLENPGREACLWSRAARRAPNTSPSIGNERLPLRMGERVRQRRTSCALLRARRWSFPQRCSPSIDPLASREGAHSVEVVAPGSAPNARPASRSCEPVRALLSRPVGRKLPKDVTKVDVYRRRDGFRYTCRDAEGRVVYDSQGSFRGRRDALAEIGRFWPTAKVSFEV